MDRWEQPTRMPPCSSIARAGWRASTARLIRLPRSAATSWRGASRRARNTPSSIATSVSWESRSAGTSSLRMAGRPWPRRARRSSPGPPQSPSTAQPASRAAAPPLLRRFEHWREDATVFEPTGLVAAQVEPPGQVLVHQLDLSFAVLGWSAPLRNGKALTEKFGEPGWHTITYCGEKDLGLFMGLVERPADDDRHEDRPGAVCEVNHGAKSAVSKYLSTTERHQVKSNTFEPRKARITRKNTNNNIVNYGTCLLVFNLILLNSLRNPCFPWFMS